LLGDRISPIVSGELDAASFKPVEVPEACRRAHRVGVPAVACRRGIDEKGRRMRSSRLLLGSFLAGLLLLPSAAAADAQVFLEDMSCTGIGAEGEGLTNGAELALTLVNKDNGMVLSRQTVTASPQGGFKTRLQANLNQVLGVRLVVATPGGSRLLFTEHVMRNGHAMCSLPAGGGLPYTGSPDRAPAVLGLAAALVAFGSVLVAVFAYRGRRVQAR